MTVKELIAVLQTMPEDVEVLIESRGKWATPTIYSVSQEDETGEVNPRGPVYIVC